jgi:hypothetical protein
VIRDAWWNWIQCFISQSNPSTVMCENTYSEGYYRDWSKEYTLVEMLEEFSIPLLLYYELELENDQDYLRMNLEPKHRVFIPRE